MPSMESGRKGQRTAWKAVAIVTALSALPTAGCSLVLSRIAEVHRARFAWIAMALLANGILSACSHTLLTRTARLGTPRVWAHRLALCSAVCFVALVSFAVHLMRDAFVARLDCSRAPSPPEGTMAERSAWAAVGMGRAYTGVVDWIRASSFFSSRLGHEIEVAPLGTPNCTRDFFTDGRFADLHLEIRGERGAGILEMSDAQVYVGTRDGEVHFRSAEWIPEGGVPAEVPAMAASSSP
jgi:hypothetical protein